MPIGQTGWDELPRPPYVTVFPMTALEMIPICLEKQVANFGLSKPDVATFTSLQAGDTEGVFQFDSDQTRWLLNQVRPARVKELAWVSALEQIGHCHPDLVTEYLERYQARLAFRRETGQGPKRRAISELPILFQEVIMNLLRQHSKLPWSETYRFIQTAAIGRMTEQHELWRPVREGLERRHGANGEELLQKLVASSRWAVCRAHHVANAITSYKAAYFRTHHRDAFEDARKQAMVVEQGE